MSIRSNSRASGADLAPELQDVLRRNGMQAHVVRDGNAYQLVVQGHDSPMLQYALNGDQLRALTDWGTNSANKKAYNTFVGLIANDFNLPRNFVHARNANGRVAMGLHGYRVGVGEYGRMPIDSRRPPRNMFGHEFLGWTPRAQEGYHMRRVGGRLFMQEPMMPERPDGRMKPGELQSGNYGFYYKGQQSQPQVQDDVLANLQTIITPVETRPRAQEPAKPYKELITSNVYFTNEKFQECLASHGIIIDPTNKTLTIQSSAAKQNFVYDLTEDEIKQLTSNSIKDVPVQKRLDIINGIIRDDFKDPITMEMLNSKEQIGIHLTPEAEAEMQAKQAVVQGQPLVEQPTVKPEEEDKNVIHVDGTMLYDLNENKAWYREGRHGREVTVEDIKAEPDKAAEGKYKMTAVINGEAITHEISQKQYEKFAALDDYHRLKLFSHIFNEVDMKTMPGRGFNLGAALTAGLVVAGDVADGMRRGFGAPTVYEEGYHRPHIYAKPGVDSPHEIAARAFDAGLNAAEHGMGHHR